MREFKFRAWDKEKKFMVVPFRLQNINFEFASNKNHIYMQYTGLKDKNGREMCEGDIVKHPAGGKFQVLWSNEDSRFHAEGLCLTDIFEVVGNIYENPDLL